MNYYETTNEFLAATLMCLGFKMVEKNRFEDTPELREVVEKYSKKGIKVDLPTLNENLKYLALDKFSV